MRRSVGDLVRRPFTRDQTLVIDRVDLDVLQGEVFGILGVNGAGKTTLLKILATLLLPDSGTATVDGYSILDHPGAVRAIVAMVTADERSLHWRLSAKENVLLFAGLHRIPPRDAKRRTAEVLATVDLDGCGEKLIGSLSSGMRQRLLLARGLLSAPRVLLLDEPTRSLDPLAARDFRQLLRKLASDGMTIVIATHNPDEAFTYCDRVGVLHGQKIAAVGKAGVLARDFAQDRYGIWTPTTEHSAFKILLRDGVVKDVVRGSDPGESMLHCTIHGEDRAADVLRRLVKAGVVITRFERAALPLASLIEHIVTRPREFFLPGRHA